MPKNYLPLYKNLIYSICSMSILKLQTEKQEIDILKYFLFA